MIAQALFASERDFDAVEAFGKARSAWLAVGDADRADVALVGQVESMQHLGRYSDVVKMADASALRGAPTNYFQVRLQSSKCIALDYLGKFSESAPCYERVLTQFDAFDERIDYVNTLQNFAIARLESGTLGAAKELATRALGLADGPYAAIVRGRIFLVLLDIDLAMGDPIKALVRADAAMGEFTKAKLPAWQARSLIKVATIYRDLGAYDEAYLAVGSALDLYRVKDAPAPVAAALLILASIDRLTRRPESALHWSQVAGGIYERLKMPQELEDAQLAQVRLELDIGNVDEAERIRTTSTSGNPTNSHARAVLEAGIDLRKGWISSAHARLDALRKESLRLGERVDVAKLDAEFWRGQGDEDQAVRVLRATARDLASLSRSTHNPALQTMLARQALPLRAAAFDALLSKREIDEAGKAQSAAAGDAVHAAWDWLNLSYGRRGLSAPSAGSDASSLDSAIASELLSRISRRSGKTDGRSASTQHELLTLFASAGRTAQEPSQRDTPRPFEWVQAQLDPDDALVAFLDGDSYGGVLYATSTQAAIYPTATPTELNALSFRLQQLVRAPGTTAFELAEATDRLSKGLLGAIPVSRAPRRLRILETGYLDSVPWSMVQWPNSIEPLLATTTVERARFVEAELQAVAATDVGSLFVVVADQQRAGRPELPELASASLEPGLIRTVIIDRNVIVAAGDTASRSSLLTMLETPGAWVHVAAHGFSSPDRIGYAGVWLEPAASDDTPPFLGWMEILGHRLKADIVVLNACQLANAGEGIGGNMSFADAVSQAGAAQVVASMWPVSDAASATWVPTFYSALAADPHHNAADALRMAQLRLRNSRAFRHPFYWAGMQTFTRMPIAPSPNMVSAKSSARVQSH